MFKKQIAVHKMFRTKLFPCPVCPLKTYLSDGPIVSDTFRPNTHSWVNQMYTFVASAKLNTSEIL